MTTAGQLPSDVMSVPIEDIWRDRERYLGLFTEYERSRFESFVVEKRRQDWLAGRVAAKHAVERATGLPLSRIEIRVDIVGRTRGRPYAVMADRGVPLGIVSVSHSGWIAVAVFSGVPTGLDLELIVPREPSFETVGFTEEERQTWAHLDGAERDEAVTKAWCMKEAIAKWRGEGLRSQFDDLILREDPRILVEEGALVDGGARYRWARIDGPRPEQPSSGRPSDRPEPRDEVHA